MSKNTLKTGPSNYIRNFVILQVPRVRADRDFSEAIQNPSGLEVDAIFISVQFFFSTAM
jgi:hypothetical protein